ncbi:MAG: hypothetical protein H7X80_01915 [bacterium]|nr:hypothetical protein [Candidatus Kapabacteria bacterium]
MLRDATGMSLEEAAAAVDKLIAESTASSTSASGIAGSSSASASSASLSSSSSASSSFGSSSASSSSIEPRSTATPGSTSSSRLGDDTSSKSEYDFASALQADLDALRAPRDPATLQLAPALADEVAALAAQNKYLDAIKLVRARTGVNLKTAKDQVEMVMEARGMKKPGNRGCIVGVFAAIIAMIGVIVAILFSTAR